MSLALTQLSYVTRVQAIFFTYALILTDFYGVDSADIGFFLIPFALGNFLGSVTIGTLIPCPPLPQMCLTANNIPKGDCSIRSVESP